MVILGNPNQAAVDIWIALAVLHTILTFCSYDQVYLLISYLINYGCQLSRSYFWMKNEKSRWVRFNIFYFESFLIIYVVSRAFNQRERQRYQSQKN